MKTALLHSTLALGLAVNVCHAAAEGDVVDTFKKITVTHEFWSEGADVADFDHDGNNDLCAGPFVWYGPDFTQRSAYSAPKPDSKKPLADADYAPNHAAFIAAAPKFEGKAYQPLSYSDYFLSYQHDFNGDGWADIAVFSWPGDIAAWYENPQKRGDIAWKRHIMLDQADNESPQLGDITGDGKPDLVCHTGGRLGFAALDWGNLDKPATFQPITQPDIKKYFRYTHGYGFGDVNGDGRVDILDKDGWREQPAAASEEWLLHPVNFGPAERRGGAQMQVYDVDGDKDADVITSWDGHGYGLAWYEQKDGAFTEHKLMGATPEDSPHGVKFSQLHAMTMADIDGDGVKDLITGKRYWAHGPNKDDEPGAPAVLYWFAIKRGKDGSVDFVPHQIDNDSGVGTQVTAADVNKDGLMDVVVSNKKGIFVFIHEKTVAKK